MQHPRPSFILDYKTSTPKRFCTHKPMFGNNRNNENLPSSAFSKNVSLVDDLNDQHVSDESAEMFLEDTLMLSTRGVDNIQREPLRKEHLENKVNSSCGNIDKLVRRNSLNSNLNYEISNDYFESSFDITTENTEAVKYAEPKTNLKNEVKEIFEKLEASICSLDTSIKNRINDKDVRNLFDWSQDSIFNSENILKRDYFFGLPGKAMKLFKIYKNVDKLYDWQNECLNLSSLKKRRNLIYALPTSGGKTLVAEILMLKEIILRKKNVLFILPFVAIVQEKVLGLSPFAVQLEFLIEEYAAGKGQIPPRKRRNKNCIYIATIEKALSLVRSLIEVNRLDEIGLVVIDELHLIGEPSRGGTLEVLLATIMYTKCDVQIIGMSATIGNIDEIATFLNAEIYKNDFRPVVLKEYVKVDDLIYAVNWGNEGSLDLNAYSVNYGYSKQIEKIDPDHIGGLVMDVIPKGSCLIFCPTKKNCENVAVLVCKVIFKQLLEHRRNEKNELLKALKSEVGNNICSILSNTIPWGVAYHHSGLTSEERRLLEDGFRSGVLNVLCCTSTLAAGVNLPAQRVILRSPFVGKNFMTLSTYKQMIGRAGRAGFGDYGESILVCSRDIFSKVCEFLNQPMDKATSSLCLEHNMALRAYILSAIWLKLANNVKTLRNLIEKTLLGVQASRLSVCIKTILDQTLIELIRTNAIEITKENSTDNCNESVEKVESIRDTVNKVVIDDNTQFIVSVMGKAAIKGCMDLEVAKLLYTDMKTAQMNVVLMGVMHLLYLVTPYEYIDIKPNMYAYYNIYCQLNDEGKQTAKMIGLNESDAVKMVTGKPITSIPDRVLKRFYVTLMLHDLWNQKSIANVAEIYNVTRGTVQNMMMSTATFASNTLRFCEVIEEFWAFRDLLVNFTKRISHCCDAEILPLMDLPNVKKGRAMQLYKAGYKKLEDIARADPNTLVDSIEHLPRKVADKLVNSAKMLLIEKVENLRDEAEEVLVDLGVFHY